MHVSSRRTLGREIASIAAHRAGTRRRPATPPAKVWALCALSWIATFAGRAHAADGAQAPPTDEQRPAIPVSPFAAAAVWTVAQLIPSPLYVASSNRVGGGVRWQITPLVYSFGVAARPVRAFIIEPVARHTGAVELYGSPEWACCAPGDVTSFIARAGVRLYLPIIGRGEALTGSVGGSYYRAGDGDGPSVEVGVYALFASVGLTVTVSPRLTGREVITALHLRYF